MDREKSKNHTKWKIWANFKFYIIFLEIDFEKYFLLVMFKSKHIKTWFQIPIVVYKVLSCDWVKKEKSLKLNQYNCEFQYLHKLKLNVEIVIEM